MNNAASIKRPEDKRITVTTVRGNTLNIVSNGDEMYFIMDGNYYFVREIVSSNCGIVFMCPDGKARGCIVSVSDFARLDSFIDEHTRAVNDKFFSELTF